MFSCILFKKKSCFLYIPIDWIATTIWSTTSGRRASEKIGDTLDELGHMI